MGRTKRQADPVTVHLAKFSQWVRRVHHFDVDFVDVHFAILQETAVLARNISFKSLSESTF